MTNQQPPPEQNQPIFAIHIIESQNEEDIFLGTREEGAALQECLNIMGVSSDRYRVTSEAYLARAVEAITAAHKPGGRFERHVPIVHLSCHGDEKGIELTKSAGLIGWDALREILRPINAAARGWLILGMSMCKGSSGHQMAWTLDEKDVPFDLLVGPTHNVIWRDSLIGFLTFYHRFTKAIPRSREELELLIQTVNQATVLPPGTFKCYLAEEERKDFRAYVVKWLAEQAEKRKQEEEQARRVNTAAMAAALRAGPATPTT